jgi:hypothetical protein
MGLITVFSGPAEADIVITATQEGGDVIVTGGGTLNLTGLGGSSPASIPGLLWPDLAIAAVGPPTAHPIDQYDTITNVTGPSSFGSGSEDIPASGSGQTFGFEFFSTPPPTEIFLWVPSGYKSGATLSGSSTYANATFSSLGLTPGTYQWTWGSGDTAGSVTLQIGVPEPSTAILALSGAVAFIIAYGWSRRRRAQRRPAAA